MDGAYLAQLVTGAGLGDLYVATNARTSVAASDVLNRTITPPSGAAVLIVWRITISDAVTANIFTLRLSGAGGLRNFAVTVNQDVIDKGIPCWLTVGGSGLVMSLVNGNAGAAFVTEETVWGLALADEEAWGQVKALVRRHAGLI